VTLETKRGSRKCEEKKNPWGRKKGDYHPGRAFRSDCSSHGNFHQKPQTQSTPTTRQQTGVREKGPGPDPSTVGPDLTAPSQTAKDRENRGGEKRGNRGPQKGRKKSLDRVNEPPANPEARKNPMVPPTDGTLEKGRRAKN